MTLKDLVARPRSVWSAIYVVYEKVDSTELLARGIALLFSSGARLFEVRNDFLTFDQGVALSTALVSCPAVVIYGSPDASLLADIGHYWPAYIDDPQHGFSLFPHVDLPSRNDVGSLATVIILVTELTDKYDTDRSGVYPLPAREAARLCKRGAGRQLSIEVIGTSVNKHWQDVTIRELFFLDERDPLESRRPRDLGECLADSDALTWTDLKTLLRWQPDQAILEELHNAGRLSEERYQLGAAALRVIKKEQDASRYGVYSDIYCLVWFCVHIGSSDQIFRGQLRAEWGLESTLLRSVGNMLDLGELQDRVALTETFLAELRQGQDELFHGHVDEESLLAVAQHFGFPTPLLDYTRSLEVAAFFATLGAATIGEAERVVGVIFHQRAFSPDEVLGGAGDNPDVPEVLRLSGVRVGKLRVIEPRLPSDENRIERQRGVFIAGYRPRDFQAVSIDRLYFRQHRNVIFEHQSSGIGSGANAENVVALP